MSQIKKAALLVWLAFALAILVTGGCGESEGVEVDPVADDGTEDDEGKVDCFRDDCAPGVCCDSCSQLSNGSTWCIGCGWKPEGDCDGTYLGCEGSCWTGENTCHHMPGVFNECCARWE